MNACERKRERERGGGPLASLWLRPCTSLSQWPSCGGCLSWHNISYFFFFAWDYTPGLSRYHRQRHQPRSVVHCSSLYSPRYDTAKLHSLFVSFSFSSMQQRYFFIYYHPAGNMIMDVLYSDDVTQEVFSRSTFPEHINHWYVLVLPSFPFLVLTLLFCVKSPLGKALSSPLHHDYELMIQK